MKGFSFLFLCLLAYSSISCGVETESKNMGTNDSLETIPVEASIVGQRPMINTYSGTAKLTAEYQANAVAQLSGIVTEMYVEEGEAVKKGAVLAKIDDRQYQIELQRAKATFEKLKNDFERNAELHEKGLISIEQFEQSKFDYMQQESVYELAVLNVERTKITAPLSGVVSQRLIRQGNVIQLNAPVFQITDFSVLHAELFIPEHELTNIKKNQEVDIVVDAFQNNVFTGTIKRISPTVDPLTGTFTTTVEVKDPSQFLKPGMFARLDVHIDRHENAMVINRDAVIKEDGNTSVFVVSNKRTFKKPILTGYVNGSYVEVLNGIAVGDTVVTIGQGSIQDSSLVQVVSLIK